jgi:branched-chain amino acid transport system ATP-binding protein
VSTPTTALLSVENIVKRFSGITALSDVSLRVESGETVGLIGPNGAGKTTLFNCLLGILRADGGRVVFDGRDITGWSVARRSRAGFGRTFQRIELFAGMTVVEHFLVAARARRGSARLWKDVLGLDRPTAEDREEADRTLELLGLTDVATRPIEALSLGRGRLVEVGRALMVEPKLLLLDEPSSGLDRAETAELTGTLDVVNRDRGTAILLVEHDVEMVQQFASRLYVLDFGTLIAEGPTRAVMSDPSVRQAYLGESSTSGPTVGGVV